MPTVGIVGYTNAGKSTLLNALVGSEVARAEDKLFATLDPTSRQVRLGDGQTAIVTDTVGFIHKLPAPARRRVPGDARGGQPGRRARRGRRRRPIRTSREHRATVQIVLDELGAGDKPRLVAYNKADLVEPAAPATADALAPVVAGSVSSQRRDRLRAGHAAGRARRRCSPRCGSTSTSAVPYAAGELLARVRERGTVELEYGERDVRVRGRMAPVLAGELTAAAERWAETLREGADGADLAPLGR